MEQRAIDLGTKSGLTQPLTAGFDAQMARLDVELYRALKLSSCWCTEKVWHISLPAKKCARCKAIDRYEALML